MSAFTPPPRIAILASGRGRNAEAIVNAALGGTLRTQVIGLISDKPGAPVLARIGELSKNEIPSIVVEVAQSREAHEAAILEKLRELGGGTLPDYLVFAGYMRRVTSLLLTPFRSERGFFRAVNVHPSLLPAFPGVRAYEQAFEQGCKVTGVTVHLVDEVLDGGPICAQESFSIADCKSVEEVEVRGLEVETRLYPRSLQWILAEEFTLNQKGNRLRVCPN